MASKEDMQTVKAQILSAFLHKEVAEGLEIDK